MILKPTPQQAMYCEHFVLMRLMLRDYLKGHALYPNVVAVRPEWWDQLFDELTERRLLSRVGETGTALCLVVPFAGRELLIVAKPGLEEQAVEVVRALELR